jgi:hypothetical protein
MHDDVNMHDGGKFKRILSFAFRSAPKFFCHMPVLMAFKFLSYPDLTQHLPDHKTNINRGCRVKHYKRIAFNAPKDQHLLRCKRHVVLIMTVAETDTHCKV